MTRNSSHTNSISTIVCTLALYKEQFKQQKATKSKYIHSDEMITTTTKKTRTTIPTHIHSFVNARFVFFLLFFWHKTIRISTLCKIADNAKQTTTNEECTHARMFFFVFRFVIKDKHTHTQRKRDIQNRNVILTWFAFSVFKMKKKKKTLYRIEKNLFCCL